MTLERIKQYIQERFDNSNPNSYDCEWSQGYECGKESAYSDCLELLEDLEPPKPTKVYLLIHDSCDDYAYSNGVYTSEYEARKHSIGYEVVEFELNKESNGVLL